MRLFSTFTIKPFLIAVWVALCFVTNLYWSGNHAYAGTLSGASDILTTSRPSVATPLSADFTSGNGNASVYNNGSTFLASDSARLLGQTNETLTVATVSAAKTTVFFTTNSVNSHANGTAVIVPITAMHTVKFVTQTALPATGSIIFSFPASLGSDTNQASPSAATFMFNNLSSANIQTNGATCGSFIFTTTAGGAQTITCNLSGSVAGSTAVTFLIGCSSATGAVCNTQIPAIINPTKTAAAGTADTWTVKLNTYSAASGGGTALDNGKLQIGTIESINVAAHIDPTFSFSITGVADGTSVNTATYCSSSHTANTSNTGFATTSTDVNLGILSSATTRYAIQTLLIQSNSVGGYTITASASGHLLNPESGISIADAQGSPTNNDTPVPVTVVAGTASYGIHVCDAAGKVSTGTWGQSPAKFANPSAAFYYTLVTANTGPVSGGDKITVLYEANISTSTSPGDYRTQMTYVATSIF